MSRVFRSSAPRETTRRATKSTALARCVRSGREINPAVGVLYPRRRGIVPRATLFPSFLPSFFLSLVPHPFRKKTTSTSGRSSFHGPPGPSRVEFDVRNNVERTEIRPPERISHLGPSPGNAGGRFSAREGSKREDGGRGKSTAIYLPDSLSAYIEPAIYGAVVLRVPNNLQGHYIGFFPKVRAIVFVTLETANSLRFYPSFGSRIVVSFVPRNSS